MKDWISLFEKYRIDRRLLDLHRGELSCLDPSSPRRASLESSIARIENDIHAAEALLVRYDEQVSSPKDALRRADERLFLTYHYVRGLTMEDTAAEMCISRDTVYRIRRRVLLRGEIPPEYFSDALVGGYDPSPVSSSLSGQAETQPLHSH